MQAPYVIALDLGTSSVGWATFSLDASGEPMELLDLGVRHFQEVMDGQRKELKNAKRRQMRGLRRNLARRRQRKDSVIAALRALGIWNQAGEPFEESEGEPYAPYRLRAEALERRLSDEELARAFYHLAQRRGFKSNRGAKMASLAGDEEVQALLAEESGDEGEDTDANPEEAKETGQILEAIKNLESELAGRTLGQFFWSELQAGRKVRSRHTRRSMYEAEFDRIWEVQAPNWAGFTEENRARLRYALFNQRPLRAQRHLVGKCTLEPTKKRAAKATLIAQRFRIASDLANLEFTDKGSGEKRRLTTEERVRIAAKLENTREMTWKGLEKELGVKNASFNLEHTYKRGLTGNLTVIAISKRAPELWDSLDEEGRTNLVETLHTAEDRGTLYRTLKSKYQLSVRVAYDLAVLELVDGYASLSARAMGRILPYLAAGLSRREAQTEAGYLEWEVASEILDHIPHPPTAEEFTSPRVRKCLNQVRRICNALVRKYERRPDCIRIEMARDMSLTKREKQELERVQKQGERENEEATKVLKEIGIANPTRSDRFWYRLAKQANWVCPYSGRTISCNQQSMSEFELEHIVPYSKSFDDSYNNLTLCHRDLNREKNNKTPFEAFGHTDAWSAMRDRVASFSGPGSRHKRNLFLREGPPDTDKMIARQLTETRWITKSASTFLLPLVARANEEPAQYAVRIESVRGGTTAMIRAHWGLTDMLDEVIGREAMGSKSRDDLRHHAVDAVAVAFTSRGTFQRLSKYRKSRANGEEVDARPLTNDVVPPAPEWLHEQLHGRLKSMTVSHETTRQIRDALHQETAYGKRKDGGYHVRKPLGVLTDKEIERIVDDGLREAVKVAIENYAAIHGKRDTNAALKDGVPYRGTVARRARIQARITENAGVLATPSKAPTKFFALGNNHHVAIFESPDGKKRVGHWVTMLEAAARVRPPKGEQARPIVDTTPPMPGWRFVMWLCGNDTVRDEESGLIYRVQLLDPASNRLWLRLGTAGSVKVDSERLLKSLNKLQATKLDIDVLGAVYEHRTGSL